MNSLKGEQTRRYKQSEKNWSFVKIILKSEHDNFMTCSVKYF